MHDFFVGLKPALPLGSVSGVSGVAKTGIIRKSNTPPDPSPCNTSIPPNAAGVSSALAATPFALPHHGMGVSNNTKQIQSIVTIKTPETLETPHDDLPNTDFLDMFHERAAIVEYDGKFPRHMADTIAYWDTFLQFVTNHHPTIRAEFDAILNAQPFH
jgi:hypothetical protein